MVRRGVAAGAGLLVFVLLVFLVRGCLDARKERAIKDYVRDTSALLGESNQQSDALFKLLGNSGGAGDVDVENALNGFRVQSDQLVDRARNLDAPGEMDTAQNYLVQTLEFRRDGVGSIADQLPNAIAESGDRKQGTEDIATDMQDFLTSDVIYSKRAAPAIDSALRKEDLRGQETVPKSQFLPNVDWLQPATVADRVGKLGGSGTSDANAAPGLHGNGIGEVTLGGQALAAGGSTSVPLADNLAFTVQVANQGENTETNVKVNVTVGAGGDAIKLSKVLDTIAAGETKPVEIPLAKRPPTGQNVPVVVEVAKVPGEQKTDNNRGEFSVIFTR